VFRLRKSVFSLLALVLLLAFAAPVAAEVTEITTFGYTDERRRASKVEGEGLRPIIWEEKGKSYSQPLVLSGARWGKPDKIMVVAVMDNKVHIYVLPKEPEPKHWQELWMNVEPTFVVPLSGTRPTASHPTFYEKNGRKYLFIGTYSQHLDIVDITDLHAPRVKSIDTSPATDITGAPLILNWRGHDIVVATSGNADRVNLISDPLGIFEGREPRRGHIDVPGRTSSSPAPINIDGKVGFVIGVDQGRNAGQIQIFYLDDLYVEENGRAVLKSRDAALVAGTYDGIAASFSVSECGTVVFFGGTRSHIYAFNVKQGKFAWVNTDHVGIFSNRSPALHEDKLYFPAVGQYHSGRLVALDKGTGRTVWDWDAVSAEGDTVRPRVQTAPVVEDIPGWGKVVLVGLSDGHIAVLPADTGDWVRFIHPLMGYLAEHRPPPDDYAWGVSGEISSCDHWMFVTKEIGLFGYMRDVYDYKAVSIDPGVPEGELAKPGQTYTGTVVFGFDGSVQDEHLPVGVGVTQDGQYLYKMHNGADVCETSKLAWRAFEEFELFPWEKPSEHFQILLPPGQRTYHFEWTAPHGQPEVELTAFINLPIPPVQVPIWLSGEFDWENNKVSVKVPVEGQVDFKLSAWTRDGCYYLQNGKTRVSVNWDVERTDLGEFPVQMKVTATGELGTKSETFTLKGGNRRERGYFLFTATEAERYPITVTAEVLNHPDVPPKTVTVYVNVCKLPEVPRDSGIHVEIISK
jgi:outer membrane protein assembly factor BamB